MARIEAIPRSITTASGAIGPTLPYGDTLFDTSSERPVYDALLEKDRQRLPIVAVGSAWAMQKDKVTIKARVDEDTLAMNIKPAK